MDCDWKKGKILGAHAIVNGPAIPTEFLEN